MVPDFHHHRFGRKGPGGLCAAALAALLLAGCSSAPKPVPAWGYEFSLGHFQDNRRDADATLMAEVPFSPREFMRHWNTHTSRDLFANVPGKLDITLTRYDATRSHMSYALSMEIMLRGRDNEGHIVAQKAVSCTVDDFALTKDWAGSMQQVVEKGTLSSLTAEGRARTMFEQVMDRCVEDIVQQFGDALVSR